MSRLDAADLNGLREEHGIAKRVLDNIARRRQIRMGTETRLDGSVDEQDVAGPLREAILRYDGVSADREIECDYPFDVGSRCRKHGELTAA